MLAILTEMGCNFKVVLILIFMIDRDIKHF